MSATAWAVMVSMGEQGYLEAARRKLETTAWITQEMCQIPEIEVIGDPIFLIAFRSDSLICGPGAGAVVLFTCTGCSG